MALDFFRAVFISDIHMSNTLPHAKPAEHGLTDRILDQQALWSRLREYCVTKGITDVYIIGDLLDTSKSDAVTLTITVACIADLADHGITVYILPGNHDAHSIDGGRFTLEAFGAMNKDGVIYIGAQGLGSLRSSITVNPWLRFHPLEFMPSASAEKAIDSVRASFDDGEDALHVLLLHQSIVGCTHVGWTCDDGLDADKVCEGFDYVISGHFHDHQTFGPDGRGMYLGAPMHHRFDDAGRPAGFWDMTFFSDGSRDAKFIDGGAPKFHVSDWEHRDIKRDLNTGDYLRFEVEATHAEWTVLKPIVQKAVEVSCKAGVRASFKHKPIYHHAARLGRDLEAAAEASMAANVSGYVDAPDVETAGLKVARLKEIGQKALSSAMEGT